MVSKDDFDDKATNLNFFYLRINFEQKYPKPAIVLKLAAPKSFKKFTKASK